MKEFIIWFSILIIVFIFPFVGIPLFIFYCSYIMFQSKETEVKINNTSMFAGACVNIFDKKTNKFGVNNTIYPNNYLILKLKKGTRLRIFNNQREFEYCVKGNSDEKNRGINI